MNTKQKRALRAGSALAALAILFPPYHTVNFGIGPDSGTRYTALWRLGDFADFDTMIALDRLALELAAVALGTGVAWLALRRGRSSTP